jgi:hypothetical protein
MNSMHVAFYFSLASAYHRRQNCILWRIVRFHRRRCRFLQLLKRHFGRVVIVHGVLFLVFDAPMPRFCRFRWRLRLRLRKISAPLSLWTISGTSGNRLSSASRRVNTVSSLNRESYSWPSPWTLSWMVVRLDRLFIATPATGLVQL